MVNRVRTPSSPVRERKREGEREKGMEGEKEGGRERIVIFIFKRNDGCLGSF
jgi:hypothetical protein